MNLPEHLATQLRGLVCRYQTTRYAFFLMSANQLLQLKMAPIWCLTGNPQESLARGLRFWIAKRMHARCVNKLNVAELS